MGTFFYLSVAMLALMLFFPATNLIWTLSVRRMQRRLDRELSLDELTGQKQRARFISALVVIVFSWLFNQQLAGSLYG